MSNITVTEQGGDAKHGRYVARVDGIEGEAELTFAKLGPDLVSADHTEAPESLRGTGAAAALVDRLVEDARQQGFKIIPECSYVRARYEKHRDWSDIFA